MDPKDLHEHLHQLNDELGRVSGADPNAHSALGGVMQDINDLMHPTGSAPPAVDAWLAERLEAIAVHFEAEHPTLAASSRRLVDLLGKAGI